MTSPSRLTEVSILVRHLVPIRQINETLIEPRLTTQTQTVSTPFNCIHRANPYASYNPDKVSHFLRTAGIMSCYPNTLRVCHALSIIYPSCGEVHPRLFDIGFTRIVPDVTADLE